MTSRLSERLLYFLVPRIGKVLISGLGVTTRWEELNRPPFEELRSDGGLIYAFWHGRLLMLPLVHPGHDIHVLISSHRDGEFISRTVARFGLHSVRGSTTRGGGPALKKLAGLLAQGEDVAITPDGPRGPARILKPGIIHLAANTGRPIVPLTFSASRRWQAGSWDSFTIPLPFSRMSLIWGDPIRLDEKEDFETSRLLVEKTMNDLTERADAIFQGDSG